MSQKERVVASLEQITSLCFQILGLVVEEEEEKAVSTFCFQRVSPPPSRD
jgi:hypothetical protein